VDRVETIETHISWVFLAGDRAYKVKKPVRLGFLDYGTLAKRLAACREEVRVNEPLAPGLYIGVRAIVPSAQGFELAPERATAAVEYAVEMHAFSEADTFDGLIRKQALTRDLLVATGRLLARFHAAAPAVSGWGPKRVRAVWQKNLRELAGVPPPREWQFDVVASFGEAFIDAHEAEMAQRGRAGLARDGHGDLRCEHVLAGRPIRIVDRIEFDPGLRRTDTASDLAFLTMDLEAHGQRWAADTLVEAYRDAGMDPGGDTLRCFYAVHWALVRAKVALLAKSEQTRGARETHGARAAHLWALARRLCWRARLPLTVLICGPPATGKSMLAAELSRQSEMPVVSSDAVRKRLAGMLASDRARAEHYSIHFTHGTYEQLARDAVRARADHGGVIVDATCGSRSVRARLFDELQTAGHRPLIIRCTVPLDVAIKRAEHRLADPERVSDATPEVVHRLSAAFEDIDEGEASVVRLDTVQPLDAQLAELTRAVDRIALAAHSR
jgi:aminoglycoside phosphotransferase family enzyme/predicted kinase